ncbi:hypothetical protein, partial [Rhizobium leguminosarum]|uniref:hypothetical protein n=1 Tax=Rhizobium leguminosarum TaxID=384 RepID=UPI003F990744
QIMQFIAMNNLRMTGEFREIYWNIDFENPENNLTEVQIGVFINGLQNPIELRSGDKKPKAVLTH